MPGLGSAGVVVVDDFERANLGGWLFDVVERHDRITGFAVEQNHGACSGCDPAGAIDAVDGWVFGFDAGLRFAEVVELQHLDASSAGVLTCPVVSGPHFIGRKSDCGVFE